MPHPAVGSVLATVLFLLIPLLWLRRVSRWRPSPAVGVALFALLAFVWAEVLLGIPFGFLKHVDWKHHHNALYVMILVHRPIADLALISAAAVLGAALSRIVTDPKMLLPIAFVGAMVDYWGVTVGTTATFIKASPALVSAVSAGIPSFGGGVNPAGVQPASYVGFGDWMFLTMFLAVAFRYDLQPRRTFWALLCFLAPAMLLIVFNRLDYLPAIVPMALAIFAVNGRRLKLSRAEAFATLYAVLMVVGLVAAYTLVVRLLR